MPRLQGFACKKLNFPHPAAPALARPEPLHTPALKEPQEAGRRGGESIARETKVLNFLLPPSSNELCLLVNAENSGAFKMSIKCT